VSAPTGFKRLGIAVGALLGAALILLVAVSYLVSAEAARDGVPVTHANLRGRDYYR